jgi:hypothetical protein
MYLFLYQKAPASTAILLQNWSVGYKLTLPEWPRNVDPKEYFKQAREIVRFCWVIQDLDRKQVSQVAFSKQEEILWMFYSLKSQFEFWICMI